MNVRACEDCASFDLSIRVKGFSRSLLGEPVTAPAVRGARLSASCIRRAALHYFRILSILVLQGRGRRTWNCRVPGVVRSVALMRERGRA